MTRFVRFGSITTELVYPTQKLFPGNAIHVLTRDFS